MIFDTNSIFPSHGENKVDVICKDGNLEVNIFYDCKEEDYNERFISFSFKHVCFHKFTSFPGVSDSIISYEKYEYIDSLVEFKYSDYKLAWEKHFNDLFKFRHFRIFFINANNYLEVICENLEIK